MKKKIERERKKKKEIFLEREREKERDLKRGIEKKRWKFFIQKFSVDKDKKVELMRKSGLMGRDKMKWKNLKKDGWMISEMKRGNEGKF